MLRVKDDFKAVFMGEGFMISLVDGVIDAFGRDSSGSVSVYTDCRKGERYFMFRSKSPVVSLVYPYSDDEMEVVEIEFVIAGVGDDYMHEYIWLEFQFQEEDILKISVILEESEDDFEAFEFMYDFDVKVEPNCQREVLIRHPREGGIDKDYSFLIKIKRY